MLIVSLIGLVAIGAYLVRRGPTGANGHAVGPATWDSATRAWVQQRRDRAAALLEQGAFDPAHAVLAELIAERDDDPVAHRLMVRVRMAKRQWTAAYESALRSLEFDANQPELHHSAGILCEKLDQFETAESHYARAMELDPSRPQFPLYRANVLLKLRRFDDAQVLALRALRLDPTTHQAHRVLAEAAAERGQTDLAIEQLDKALALVEIETIDTLAYTLRKAEFLRRKGPAAREEALNILAALPPSMQGVRVEIAEQTALTYLSLGRPADAAGVWEVWFTAHPRDARAAAEAGLAHHRAGNTERARRWYDKARRLAEHLPQVRALGKALGV